MNDFTKSYKVQIIDFALSLANKFQRIFTKEEMYFDRFNRLQGVKSKNAPDFKLQVLYPSEKNDGSKNKDMTVIAQQG